MSPAPEVRVLVLEDQDADAELIVDSLEHAGMTVRWRQVKARDTFEAALKEFGPDVVLVDYSLPGFDGGRR